MSKEHVVEITTPVTITINDPDVIERALTAEWQIQMYPMDDEAAVLEHIAYNAIYNNVTRVNELDGWADMADDAATMSVERY